MTSTTLMITLTEHDLTALQAQAKGNVSYVIRDLVSDYDLAHVAEYAKTDRKACRFSDDLLRKLKADADALNTSVSGLIRAIIESKLQTQH